MDLPITCGWLTSFTLHGVKHTGLLPLWLSLAAVRQGERGLDRAVRLRLPLRAHPNVRPHLHIPQVTRLVSRVINQTSAAQFTLLM